MSQDVTADVTPCHGMSRDVTADVTPCHGMSRDVTQDKIRKDKRREDNKIPPIMSLESLDGRAREDYVTGGGLFSSAEPVDGDTPGIEFQELRFYYNEHAREEAPLSGFTEYRQLRASKRWPGFGVIQNSISAYSAADPENWKNRHAPGLGKFLREHWWKVTPKARASPARNGKPGAGDVMLKNSEISRQIMEEIDDYEKRDGEQTGVH
jgi:hypothetical protein